jgi:hypothetical protein
LARTDPHGAGRPAYAGHPKGLAKYFGQNEFSETDNPHPELEEEPMNPRLALLLANYQLHDRMTAMLAGIALLSVLTAWSFSIRASGNRQAVVMRTIYYVFLLVAWIGILAVPVVVIWSGRF